MKKLMYKPVLSRLTVVVLLLTTILFAACSKNNDDFVQPSSARLMAFNLAPDKPAVGFTLSANQLGSVLGYTSYTGGYINIFPGNRELRSFDNANGNQLATSTFNFADSIYYSAFLVGYNGAYRHTIVKDDYSTVTPVAGKAWVRYINAVADSNAIPNVTIGSATQTAAFGTVSDFKQVDAGSLTASIASGSYNASRTITTTENRIYTILFVGQPGSTDAALAVQAKFIENGTAAN